MMEERDVLLQARDVCKWFPAKGGLLREKK